MRPVAVEECKDRRLLAVTVPASKEPLFRHPRCKEETLELPFPRCEELVNNRVSRPIGIALGCSRGSQQVWSNLENLSPFGTTQRISSYVSAVPSLRLFPLPVWLNRQRAL